MTRLKQPFRRLFRRARAEDGSVTIEFVLALPIFLIVFMSTIEAGLLLTRSVMLDRAVDLSVRDLRLGIGGPPTHDSLKQAICDRILLVPDCLNVVMLELRPVSTTTWEPLNTNATCINRNEEMQPLIEFRPGTSNEMMLVRACAVMDPYFPTTGLGLKLPKDASGGYQLIASSAFVNEPRL